MPLLEGVEEKAQADIQVDLEQVQAILRNAIVQAGALLLGILNDYTVEINFVKKP